MAWGAPKFQPSPRQDTPFAGAAAWWLLRGREKRSGQRTWGRKRRHVGVGGWFCSIRSPREIPGKPRMARGVRTKLGRFPDENENLGARLGRFSPSGCKKRLVGGFSGRRVEMLLGINDGAPVMAPDNLAERCCGSCWETPRGRCDEHSSKFSLSTKPMFNRPVGERSDF